MVHISKNNLEKYIIGKYIPTSHDMQLFKRFSIFVYDAKYGYNKITIWIKSGLTHSANKKVIRNNINRYFYYNLRNVYYEIKIIYRRPKYFLWWKI